MLFSPQETGPWSVIDFSTHDHFQIKRLLTHCTCDSAIGYHVAEDPVSWDMDDAGLMAQGDPT